MVLNGYNDKLVGGWATPLKNIGQSVGMIIPYKYGKINFMFQSTNQDKLYQLYPSISPRTIHQGFSKPDTASFPVHRRANSRGLRPNFWTP